MRTSAEAIGLHLQFSKPFIFAKNIPKWAEDQSEAIPELLRVIKGEKIVKKPGNSRSKPENFKISTLKTLGGIGMTGFAKLPAFDKDLYADLVAPTLNSR